MSDCLISFGSNLGNSEATIAGALEQLADRLQSLEPDPIEFRASPWFSTRPIGGPAQQPGFINGACRFRATREPKELLELLLEIEQGFGRERRTRWDARVLDLDLLLYGDRIINGSGIQVPHPRMSFRQFVLQPACRIAPEMVHPICGVSLEALLECIQTRREDILLVSSRPRLAPLESWVAEQAWGSAVQLSTVEQLPARVAEGFGFKLVVVDESSLGVAWPEVARQAWVTAHRGPILLLEDTSPETLQVELSAALAAMKAL